MATSNQQIDTPAVPDLPTPESAYSSSVFTKTNAALRIYFTRISTALAVLFGPRGGKYLNIPYGAFQDSTDQTAASTTAAYAITFNTTDYNNGVTLSNSSRLNVSQSGIYNIQFSIQFKNTTAAPQDVDVWFMKNGTNIDNSNSRFGLAARKSAGDPYHIIASMNFFASLAENDYIQIMWRTTDTGVSIEQYPTSTSPTRPAVPSVIATLSFVSNISA